MLPERFKQRAEALLGNEYAQFIAALGREPVRGARASLIKTSTDRLTSLLGEHLTPIGYTDNGFILADGIRIGQTPEHHAGMLYVQDPGAMAALSALDIKPDWWVADLCAAPGGKSSQIAERLGEGGFLLSNEYVPKRAKIIVGNFERLGIGGAVVTSLDTAELAKMYRAVFDLVVADAPCSGEGMFRKSEEALTEWSEENILACAKRQREILDNASGLVKAGGYLLYSTCTYSIEENEGAVSDFLAEHPDFALVPVREELVRVTRDGIRREGITAANIEYCRRFYPHVSEGEGQFVALMRRSADADASPTILYKDSTKPLSKRESEIIGRFFRESLCEAPQGRLAKYGQNIVLISHGCPVPEHSTFMSGVLVGEITGEVFKPSHHFFSVYGGLFRNKLCLGGGDPRADEYLRGAEIDAPEVGAGYCAVIYEGAPLGGGKVSGGRLKNHYPKGLRNKG